MRANENDCGLLARPGYALAPAMGDIAVVFVVVLQRALLEQCARASDKPRFQRFIVFLCELLAIYLL